MIEVIFQNSSWIAVNKPEGISVHNNEDPKNLLVCLEKQLKFEKLYPPHRLDKETSGIQILALNKNSAQELSEAFESRSVKKIYVGILRGKLKSHEGTWSHALTDKAEGRKNPAGLSRERIPCETRFKVIQDSKFFSYCEFQLMTGRQHQIRKHSALSNHAIVGDSRYGDKKYNEKMASLYKTTRMFLHCTRMEILGQTLISPAPHEFSELK